MAVSKAKLESNKKSMQKYWKNVGIKFRKEEYEALKEYCNTLGLPVNGFVRQVMMKAINYNKYEFDE